ncbi:MAG: Aspartyl-tRNA synthetase [Candidatus Saccharibacteria bacterium]|nr:Aspartyl-tRNA synthetase [Candidatus Saccharibacteria bacterium]
MRTLAKEVANQIGSQVTVSGWIHKKRLLGGLTFINVRDRSGLVQIVIQNKEEVEKLRGLQIGTVVNVTGTAVEEPRAPGGAELHDAILEIIVPVEEVPAIEIDKPIDHKSENQDTLFDNRVLNVRNLHEQKIFRIRSEINRYIREFLHSNEFVEIQTPKLLAGATEGGAEIFKLDYFGQEATLAQSPQLYKQIMVGAFERVFEIGPAFRAEPSMTTRHMSESTMLDIEMGFIEGHEDVLKMAENMVYTVLTRLYEEHGDALKSLNAPELVLKPDFPRFTVAEVHEMYTKATKDDTTEEKDMTPAEERWICEYAKKNLGSEAVFVTEFPIEAHKFYQKINPENPQTVLWADLLFRGVEISSAPMRENNYDKLVQQMKDKGIDPTHPGFKFYLQAFKAGLPPHGGFGFGLDRFVQKTVGLNSVKEATLFPRDINRLAP